MQQVYVTCIYQVCMTLYIIIYISGAHQKTTVGILHINQLSISTSKHKLGPLLMTPLNAPNEGAIHAEVSTTTPFS